MQEWQCAWADGQVQLQGTLPTCEPQVEPTKTGDRWTSVLLAASWRNPMKYSYIPHKHLETIVIGDDLPTKDRVFPETA